MHIEDLLSASDVVVDFAARDRQTCRGRSLRVPPA